MAKILDLLNFEKSILNHRKPSIFAENPFLRDRGRVSLVLNAQNKNKSREVETNKKLVETSSLVEISFC